MAANKRKILDAARKYAQKGARDKALKEYHTLLKLDPRDAKLHLEIGDCYRRWGQIDEAITQYARVAEQYKDDGFDARAVAVFKQILHLDPKRYSAYVSLSELYERMGLDAEALSMLQAAADAHNKEGNKREALELLRRMANLDPTNTTSRLKVAELLRQEGLERDAVAEYELVAKELARQGALESVISVEERILEVEPERADVVLSLGGHLVELGKAEQALPLAKRVLENDPEETDAHELLIEAHRVLGQEEELAAATRSLARIFRDRGDESRARELSQSISSGSLDFEQEPVEAVERSDSEYLQEDDLLDDDFLAPDTAEGVAAQAPDSLELDLGEDCEELLLEEDESGIGSNPEDSAAEAFGNPADGTARAGDCEQLLAEATVYLRYGKCEEAIESLEAILAREPENCVALEKLGAARAESGAPEGAVEAWSRAAVLARAGGDEEGFSTLRDRVAEFDAAAAEDLAAAPVVSVVDEEFERATEASEELEPGDPGAIDLPETEESASTAVVPEPSDPDAEEGFASIDFEVEIELDEAGTAGVSEPEPEAAASSSHAGSTTTSQQVAEDLEEADFYRQQGLYDAAESICRRVLEVAPNHPGALLRLGEMAAERGGDPADVAGEVALDPVLDPDPAQDEMPAASETSIEEGDGLPALSQDPASHDLAGPDDTLSLEEDFEDLAAASLPQAAADAGSAGLPDAASFDLAAELRGVIEDPGASLGDSAVLSTLGDGLESIFADFKQAVTATLSENDYETRYGLGIAYREMELYDDAIGEFRMCLDSPSHKLTSLHMMGLCALDLGRAEDAANHFKQVLSTPDLPAEQLGGLRFDLARAFEAQEAFDRARSVYESVLEIDPDFPGVAERLQRLAESGGSDAASEASVDLGFESFDDLISEAESVLGRGEEARDDPGRPERRATPRKKKISFV